MPTSRMHRQLDPGSLVRFRPAALAHAGRLLQSLLLGLALSAGAWGQAESRLLRVCIANEEVPPFTSTQSEALGQVALREAARRQDWQVQFSIRPWRRCLAETASGHFQAVLPVSPSVENRSRLTFPQLAGKPDLALRLGEVRVLVVRPLGSAAEWDGQRFSGLTGPVLYLGGLSLLDAYFSKLSQASDHSANNAASMARMLLSQRSNMGVDIEDRILSLLAQDEFRGRLEVLPRPLLSAPVFMAVSPALYAESPRAVERLWRDTAELLHVALARRAQSR